MSELQKTPFHAWHVANGGRMVEFGGWHMPVQYTSIIDEHHAVRRAAGLFDIAHMGRLRFTGPDVVRFLDHLLTNDVASLKLGQVRYSLVTNDAGGVSDDVLVYRFESCHILVVNASNRLKIVDWIERHRGGFNVRVEDLTLDWSMFALQGPRAIELISAMTTTDVASLKYYFASETNVLDVPSIVSRTGYTGEDGVEVMLPNAHGQRVWDELIERGRSVGLVACGLGCRDTLRLEAAMPLYGHELSESTDPITAGLSFAVKLTSKEFIGKSALLNKPQPPAKRRVGIVLAGRRIAREGSQIFAVGTAVDSSNASPIGEVTSGTFSPTLEKSIAMAYVTRDAAVAGTSIEVDVRGKRESATIVDLPFYRRAT